MKVFLELGDRYAAKSDWKDFALTKFCLASMGVMLGTMVVESKKPAVRAAAAGVFLATYVPLMTKVYGVAKEMAEEKKKTE